MAGSGRKWLIGCGAGCGGFILLIILISVGGSLWLMKPMNAAVDSQKALDERFGVRDTYAPPAGGITADRMEIFLEVRRGLMPSCEKFREIAVKFDRMDELDKDGDPSTGEALKAVGGLMGSLSGMVAEIGRFTETRNAALLENGMGLGEYIWIYVLAYHSWLGYQPGTSFDSEGDEELSRNERKVIRLIMKNHAGSLAEAGLSDQAEIWEREILRLERSESDVPFAGADLPESLVSSFTPYGDLLRSLYCEETAGFELNTIKKKGLSIQSN